MSPNRADGSLHICLHFPTNSTSLLAPLLHSSSQTKNIAKAFSSYALPSFTKSTVHVMTRLTYNCAHFRSTKESLTILVKFFGENFFEWKFFGWIFLGENLFGEIFFWWTFFGWTFFGWKLFFVNIFWVKILWVKIFFGWKNF